MKLDLTLLLNKRASCLPVSFEINPEAVEDAPLLPEDITLSGNVRVDGKVCDNDGYMTLRAKISADYETVCDRCLAPLSGTVEFDYVRIIASDGGAIGVDEDEILAVDEGGVNFDRDALECLSLELPIYHLCSDECPGLCSVCGKRLDGSCKCEKQKEIDPRMETFQKLLEKMDKE